MTKNKDYFVKSFYTILLGLLIFYCAKQVLPDKIFSFNSQPVENTMVDTMALEAMKDENSDTAHQAISPDLQIIPSSKCTSGFTQMLHFYSKLEQLERTRKGKVRIGYYGDSMTDGDLIVQDIRKQFQDQFGGEGVGYVGMTSVSANSRGSVLHHYSDNWSSSTFLRQGNARYHLGIDGQVSYLPSGSGWLQLAAGNMQHSELMPQPTLLYGKSDNSSASISASTDKGNKQIKLNTQSLVNEAFLSDSAVKSLRVNFSSCGNIPFYGVNIEGGDGVYVDNFSMRGNSGLPLVKLDVDLMNDLDSILNYDLIVLHYGANLIGYQSSDFLWYESKMYNAMLHLRECFPHADFLIISSADKSTKYGGKMQTHKNVLPLIEAQRKFAVAIGCGFINLYELMGGRDSMVAWVNASPPYAGKDYTHFNIRGSHKIAELLCREIEWGYQQYKLLKKQGKLP